MLKRIVSWLVLVPLALILVIFAMANRQPVTVYFDPLSQTAPFIPPLSVPMFGVIYALLLCGILLGGIATWVSQGKNRKAKRAYKREAEALHREVDALKKPGPRPHARTPVDELMPIE